MYPPDTNAARHWLNNRQRDKWRERQEITGADGDPLFRLRQMTDEQRVQEALALIQEARKALDDAKEAGLITDADYEEVTDEES